MTVQSSPFVRVGCRTLLMVLLAFCIESSAAEWQTAVSIVDGRWHINGQVTYPDSAAEGLLMNVRMVNATFEDRNRDDFDPDANTARFLKALPEYRAQGVRAITLCLQGGMPGYEGALNSAFTPKGNVFQDYLMRVGRVIEACDSQGMVVILGCFYQRQDQMLEDEEAVRTGLGVVVGSLKALGYTNVVLEVANEFGHGGFNHEILKTPEGQVELIKRAKRANPDLLVSTSGLGNGRAHEEVAEAADFLLIHFNNTSLDDIPARIQALKHFGKPIVCNEDDKQGAEAAQAARLCVENDASYGLMLSEQNQYEPFEFQGAADDPVVYAAYKELTTP